MSRCRGKARWHSPELLLHRVLPWEAGLGGAGSRAGTGGAGKAARGIHPHPVTPINPLTAGPELAPRRQAMLLSHNNWIRIGEQKSASKLEESLGWQS